MIANLYLHPDTFKYNNKDTKEQVSAKLVALVDDMTKIVYEHSEENKFKIPTALFNVPVFENMSIVELAEVSLNPDEKGVFYTMIEDTSDDYDNISIEDLLEKCVYMPQEKEVYSILVFNLPEEELTKSQMISPPCHQTINNNYITFDRYEVVYSKQTWLHLRRQILGNHPENPDHFIKECRKYFPKLCIHDNCVSSLIDTQFNYLETSSRKLVYYLSCLNDNFSELYERHKLVGSNADTILTEFSGLYGLDESGSLQQRPEKKALLSFVFLHNNGEECNVICEPHLKISQEDKNSKIKNINYQKFHPRIYFSFPNPDIENGRIPVGSIGKHI